MPKLATVVTAALNVRNQPSVIGSTVLRVLRRDNQVEVEDRPIKADNIIWRRLAGGGERWIAEIDLTTNERFITLSDITTPQPDPNPQPQPEPDPQPEPEPKPSVEQTWVVTTGVLNIRNAPNLSGDVVRQARQGASIVTDANFIRVGRQGWVWHKVITTDNSEEWVAEVNKISDQRLMEIAPDGVVVIEPPTTGSVVGRVKTNGMQFTVDGRAFRFMGANVREFAYYGRPDLLPAANIGDQDVQINALRQIGMRVVRLFAPHHRIDGNTSINLVKAALDKLHANGLLAIVVLTDSLGDSGYNIPQDKSRFHNQVLGHPNKTTYFHQGGYKQFYLPFVRNLVTTLRDHPGIFAWEIGNEFAIHPQPANSFDGDIFLDFHRTVSDTIRSIERNHLITTGLVNTGHGTPAFQNGEDYARKLYSLPAIDFATIHFYQVEGNPGAAMGSEESRSMVDLRTVRALNKPIIVEEFGSTIGNHNRVDFTARKVQQWMNAGAAGFMQWGFSATGRDIGVGDNRHGMDNYSAANSAIYNALVNVYRDWANRVANG